MKPSRPARIQLALHYRISPSLSITNEKPGEIYLLRIKEPRRVKNMDFDNIINHIDKLSQEGTNGRQIRNAIIIRRRDSRRSKYKGMEEVLLGAL